MLKRGKHEKKAGRRKDKPGSAAAGPSSAEVDEEPLESAALDLGSGPVNLSRLDLPD